MNLKKIFSEEKEMDFNSFLIQTCWSIVFDYGDEIEKIMWSKYGIYCHQTKKLKTIKLTDEEEYIYLASLFVHNLRQLSNSTINVLCRSYNLNWILENFEPQLIEGLRKLKSEKKENEPICIFPLNLCHYNLFKKISNLKEYFSLSELTIFQFRLWCQQCKNFGIIKEFIESKPKERQLGLWFEFYNLLSKPSDFEMIDKVISKIHNSFQKEHKDFSVRLLPLSPYCFDKQKIREKYKDFKINFDDEKFLIGKAINFISMLRTIPKNIDLKSLFDNHTQNKIYLTWPLFYLYPEKTMQYFTKTIKDELNELLNSFFEAPDDNNCITWLLKKNDDLKKRCLWIESQYPHLIQKMYSKKVLLSDCYLVEDRFRSFEWMLKRSSIVIDIDFVCLYLRKIDFLFRDHDDIATSIDVLEQLIIEHKVNLESQWFDLCLSGNDTVIKRKLRMLMKLNCPVLNRPFILWEVFERSEFNTELIDEMIRFGFDVKTLDPSTIDPTSLPEDFTYAYFDSNKLFYLENKVNVQPIVYKCIIDVLFDTYNPCHYELIELLIVTKKVSYPQKISYLPFFDLKVVKLFLREGISFDKKTFFQKACQLVDLFSRSDLVELKEILFLSNGFIC